MWELIPLQCFEPMRIQQDLNPIKPAYVFNEGRINVLLWYCLVGAYVGLPLGVVGSPRGK